MLLDLGCLFDFHGLHESYIAVGASMVTFVVTQPTAMQVLLPLALRFSLNTAPITLRNTRVEDQYNL
jgi:hypothetical protein